MAKVAAMDLKSIFWRGLLVVALVGNAYCQWEPEVLLHRQGDRLGWFYEKVKRLGDWTGDGIDDFAVLSYTLSDYSCAIDIWWGGEVLSADPDTTIVPLDSCWKIENAGDLTGDGIPELVGLCWSHELVTYRGGRGQGELLQDLQVLEMDLTDIAIPGDISGDGIPNLILGSYNDSKIIVYLGTPTGFEGPVETLEGVGHHLGGQYQEQIWMGMAGKISRATLTNGIPLLRCFTHSQGTILDTMSCFTAILPER